MRFSTGQERLTCMPCVKTIQLKLTKNVSSLNFDQVILPVKSWLSFPFKSSPCRPFDRPRGNKSLCIPWCQSRANKEWNLVFLISHFIRVEAWLWAADRRSWQLTGPMKTPELHYTEVCYKWHWLRLLIIICLILWTLRRGFILCRESYFEKPLFTGFFKKCEAWPQKLRKKPFL